MFVNLPIAVEARPGDAAMAVSLLT
jgi:hypothetical protein